MTQMALKTRLGCDWTKRFYQYANRLVHHYYFVNAADVGGPKSKVEWRAGIDVLHEGSCIRGRLPSKRVADVLVDVAPFAVGGLQALEAVGARASKGRIAFVTNDLWRRSFHEKANLSRPPWLPLVGAHRLASIRTR